MLTTQWQNQTLPPQQILTPSTTHNILALRPPAAPGARRRLHYLEETRHDNNNESSSRDHSCHYHNHAQSKYFECTPRSYHEIHINHHNRHSTPSSLRS